MLSYTGGDICEQGWFLDWLMWCSCFKRSLTTGIKPPLAQMVESHGFWEARYHGGQEGGVYSQIARGELWFCHLLVSNLAQTTFSMWSSFLV